MAKQNINQIMAAWKGGKPPAPKMPALKAAVVKPPVKASGGVPGLMATRNNLKGMRQSTLPKGCK